MTLARPSGVEDPTGVARAFGARANDSARRRFAPRYLLNTLRNIPRIAASADVRALVGAFPGAPAVVVAAGPSLDRTIGWLRALPPHVLLIAVDTATRPLLEAGVEPHVVVAVDPSELNARHLRHLPDTGRTWLVAEGSLDPSAFEWWDGRTFTFAVSNHEPWPWLQSAGVGRGRLRAWGSVLTTAVDLALQAGCAAIGFVGADLAYTGGRPYCRGTVYEHDWARRVACGESLDAIWAQATAAKAGRRAVDIHGRPVPTTAALLAFRDWIVEQSTAFPSVRFLNATGAGVLQGGRIEVCTQPGLASLLRDGRRGGTDAARVLRDAWQRGRCADGDGVPRVQAALARADRASATTEPLAAWCRFAGPDLAESSVRQALAEAAAGLATAHHPAGTGPTIRAAGAPDRAAAIRAAVTGRHPRPAVRDAASATTAAMARASERASRCLAALLTDPSPLVIPDEASAATSPVAAPAVHAHRWTPTATPLVLDYGTALAALLTASGSPAPESGTWLRLSLDAPVSSVRGAGARTTPPADTAARIGLVADGLSVAAALACPTDESDRATYVAAAVLRAYAAAIEPAGPAADAGPSGAGDALVDVSIAGRHYAARCATHAPGVTAALTGSLVRVGADSAADGAARRLPALSVAVPEAGPHDITLSLSMTPVTSAPGVTLTAAPRWLRAARSRVPYDVVMPHRLNPAAMPCMIGGTWDESHALFTLVNRTHGLRINEAGDCAVDAPWPRVISGQVRWGATGAIAWHSGDRRVLWRERPDGAVDDAPMPLAGARAFPQPDGTIWWTSVLGGLWSWTPGHEWHRLVDTPPLMCLQTTDGRIRLEPRGDNLSFAVREPLTEAYEWTPGSETARAVPLGPEGPCWSTAQSAGWTALAYPHADAVLLRHADGHERVLACHYPFNTAWAGASLVVSTGEGGLWVFSDLLTRLTHDV